MSYVDGYLVPLPKRSLPAYKRMATLGRKIWMKHGALDYKECAGDDLFPKWGESFAKMMKLKRGETVCSPTSCTSPEPTAIRSTRR